MPIRQPVLLVLLVGLLASACASSVETSSGPSVAPASPGPCTEDPVLPSVADVTGSGLDWLRGAPLPDSFGPPLLTLGEIVPVLRPDGIPAIDDPTCTGVDAVDWLEDEEAVVVVELGGVARAYPLQILTWHELVNDTVGGTPVTISYCPLCNSAIAYDRRVEGRVLDFGTSGALHQSALVMYDRQTETLWTHLDGTAVAGELAGTRLDFFATAVVSWETFRTEHPDGQVLARPTGGRSRSYGSNPYPGYGSSAEPLDDRFLTREVDDRLAAKARVIGVERGGEAVAVPHAVVVEEGVVRVELAGESLVVWNLPGTASAIDGTSVAGGPDVGASVVVRPEVDGRTLSFSRVADGFVDDQTGSTWSVLGRAVAGELEGSRLEIVPALDTFWFAWASFHAETAVWDD